MRRVNEGTSSDRLLKKYRNYHFELMIKVSVQNLLVSTLCRLELFLTRKNRLLDKLESLSNYIDSSNYSY